MVTADPTTAPSPPTSTAEGAAGRLQHLPVTVFAVVMGLGGTAVAWQPPSVTLGVPRLFGDLLTWLALAVFAVAAGAYGLKVARHLPAVRAKWRHPVKLAFVPTASIALVILALTLDVLRTLDRRSSVRAEPRSPGLVHPRRRKPRGPPS